jgi:hypothetical protein
MTTEVENEVSNCKVSMGQSRCRCRCCNQPCTAVFTIRECLKTSANAMAASLDRFLIDTKFYFFVKGSRILKLRQVSRGSIRCDTRPWKVKKERKVRVGKQRNRWKGESVSERKGKKGGTELETKNRIKLKTKFLPTFPQKQLEASETVI